MLVTNELWGPFYLRSPSIVYFLLFKLSFFKEKEKWEWTLIEYLSSRIKAELQNGGKTVTHKTKQQWMNRRKTTDKPITPSFSQDLTKKPRALQAFPSHCLADWLNSIRYYVQLPDAMYVHLGQAPFFIKYKGNIYDSTWNPRMMFWKSRTLVFWNTYSKQKKCSILQSRGNTQNLPHIWMNDCKLFGKMISFETQLRSIQSWTDRSQIWHIDW